MKAKAFFLIIVFLASLAFSIYFYYWLAVSRKNFDGRGLAEFTVKTGQKVYEIAENLRQEKLINSASAFKLYIRFNNLGGKLQAGSYRLPRNLSIKEIAEILQSGRFDVRLTFPEGWRREEMAFYAAKQLKRPSFYEEFLKSSQNLEGRLFPETYFVSKDVSAGGLTALMTGTFRKKYNEVSTRPGVRQDLNEEAVLILASIVEREARTEEDRPLVAGILIKRWRSGWPLEADATVQFAVSSARLPRQSFETLARFEFWPRQITFEDLKTVSAYNTRQSKGLPIGPICSPGAGSLLAVFKAVETPYWFYLNDEKGTTYFAKTLAEHQGNVQQYLRP